MRIKLVLTTSVDDNNAVLKFSLQRVFRSGYSGLNFVPNKVDVTELQFARSRRLGKSNLKKYLEMVL